MSKEDRPFVPKTPMDFQKMKLDRLMANPDKPVIIPETLKKEKNFTVPEFVRNVMGSSAGAGSGEFHVYRHLRRKEYTRQKMIEGKSEQEKLDEEFNKKLEENKRKMEERTAKKRIKRLRKKKRLKEKASNAPVYKEKVNQAETQSSSGDDCSEDENSNEHGNSETQKDCMAPESRNSPGSEHHSSPEGEEA